MKKSWKECLLMFDDARSCERVVALRKTMMHAEKYVYFRIDSVSRSGLSRTMAVYIVINGGIRDITQEVSLLLGYSFNREKWLMRVNGGGTALAAWLPEAMPLNPEYIG